MGIWTDLATAIGGTINRGGADIWHAIQSTNPLTRTHEPAAPAAATAIGEAVTGAGKAKTEKERPKRKKPAAKGETEAERQAAIEQAILRTPYAQASRALVEQYQEAQTVAQPLASGAATAPATQAAATEALALTGLSPQSSGGQWLSSALGAAQAASAPLTQAMAQYGQEYAQQALPVTQALANYGQANALEVMTAPEQAWMNALASHITSNLSYYGEIPKADVGSLQPYLVTALQKSGGYGGGGTGLVPLSALKTTAATGKVTTPAAATTASGVSALGAGGTIPGASPTP